LSTSVTESTRAGREDAPPDWSPVPERGAGGEPSRLKILWRALAAGVLVVALWLLGHEPGAVILLTLLVAVTTLSATVPAVARAVERGEGVVQAVAGRGLRFVLLGVLQLVIFTPVSLVLRLLRHDPLALGSAPDDASFWRPAPAKPRPLHRRLYTYERVPVAAGGRDRMPLHRLRTALGVIALLLALDIGVGAAIDAIDGDSPGQFTGSLSSQLLYPDAEAGRQEPWRHDLGWEITRLWDVKRYHPYLGWTLPDYAGRYVHVKDGARRTYEPAAAAAGDAIDVYFLGGSALFGWFQRDLHTIPSEFARLAEADGIPVRVVNYARPAYANWQESLLLQDLVTGGNKPDLALFYDGVNELVSQFTQGVHDEPDTTLTRQIADELGLGTTRRPEGDTGLGGLTDAWAKVSAVHRAGERLGIVSDPNAAEVPVLVSPWLGDQTENVRLRGRDAASIYARGVDVTRRLARSYGFGVDFFWQPFVYSKRRVKGEEQAVGSLGTDPEAWTAASDAARSNLAPGVVDLSTALDGTDDPVLYDFVHTNELGARVMAEAIYRGVRPQLLELARERR